MRRGPAGHPANPLQAAPKKIFKRAAKGELNSGLPQYLGFQNALSLPFLDTASYRYIGAQNE